MKNILFYTLLVALLLPSCRKNIDDTEWTDQMPDPEVVEVLGGDVLGIISDEAGNPVSDALIRLGDSQTTTDSLGVFVLPDADLRSNGAYLTAGKPGFFPGSRTFLPVEGKTSQVRITLLKRTVVGTIEATQGGTVETPEGAMITFPPGGVVTANGTAYTGSVEVAARWIDPSDPEMGNQMPGDLRAVDANSERVVLASFGMMAVELQDPAGNELQPAPGSPATLSFPVPPEMLSAAPQTIPLWYFDEEMGTWIEEGNAQLAGDRYEGEVSHFSWWNCDIPGRPVPITGQVVSESGIGLTGIYLSFEVDGVVGTSSGYTMEDGYFAAQVPADEVLTLKVFDSCAEIVGETEVGPFLGGEDIGQIVIPDSDLITITGNLVNCLGNTVENGFVLIELSGNNVFDAESDGSFSATMVYCDQSEFSITGTDIDNLESGSPESWPIAETVDVGNVEICGNPLEPPYISLFINGENYFWSSDSSLNFIGSLFPCSQVDGTNFGLSAPSTQFFASYDNWTVPEQIYLELVIPTQDVATDISEAYLSIQSNNEVFGPLNFSEVYPMDACNINEYGPFSGDPVRGFFEATIPQGPGVPQELEIFAYFAFLRE